MTDGDVFYVVKEFSPILGRVEISIDGKSMELAEFREAIKIIDDVIGGLPAYGLFADEALGAGGISKFWKPEEVLQMRAALRGAGYLPADWKLP